MRTPVIHLLILLCSAAITSTAIGTVYWTFLAIFPIFGNPINSSPKLFPSISCDEIQWFCHPKSLLYWPVKAICAWVPCSRSTDSAFPSPAETLSPSPDLRYNFAIDIAGAQVIYQMTSPTHDLTLWCRMKRWWTGGEASCDHEFVLPTEVIRAGEAVEGECWTFEGEEGHIAIRLSDRVNISDLTIQRVMPFPSAALSQAPRNISLWGLVNHATSQEYPGVFLNPAHFHTNPRFPLPDYMLPTDAFVLLGQFQYDLSAELVSSTQKFPIQTPDFVPGLQVIILDVSSNWGSPFTCLSRVKIHGIPMSASYL